jgi:hypothetical protein
MTSRCEAWRYTFLEEAAEEARRESRRYWASADKNYPQQPCPEWWWPIGPDEPALRNSGGLILGRDRQRHAWRVAGKLLRAVSIDPRFAAGLLHAWNLTYCRPPLAEAELKQTFDRVATLEAERLERMCEKRAA